MKAVLLIVALPLFSCVSSSKVSQQTEQSRIVRIEKLIDTIRVLERDTTSFRALLECDSMGQVRIATLDARDSEISQLKSSLKNNVLDIQVETQTIERIKELVRIDTVYVEKLSAEYERVVVPVSWWRKILMWLGVAFIVMNIPKLIKFVMKFI